MKKWCGMLALIASLLVTSCSNLSFFNKDSTSGTEYSKNLCDRVNELCSNLDNLPSAKDACGVNNTSNKKSKVLKAWKDYSSPSDDYYSYPAYQAFFEEDWNYADSLRDSEIEQRDYVISSITQYDTWVETDLGARYMISYNAILDQVNVKCLSPNNIMQEFTSGYNSLGKLLFKLKQYCLYTNDGDNQYIVETLDYVEGQKWVYTRHNNRDYNNFINDTIDVIEANLKTNEMTEMHYRNAYDQEEKTNATEYNISLQSKMDDLYFIGGIENEKKFVQLFDEQGCYIIKYNDKDYNNNHKVEIPLYALNGWTSASSNDDNEYNYDELTVTIGEKTYKEESHNEGDFSYRFYLDSCGTCYAPFIEVSYKDSLSLNNALSLAFNATGLSYKDNMMLDKVKSSFNQYDEIMTTRNALERSDFSKVTKDDISSIYNFYASKCYSRDEFLALYNQKTISIDNQVKDTSLYTRVNTSSNGSITFNKEDKSFVFNDYFVEYTKNSYIDELKEYHDDLILYCDDGYEQLCSTLSSCKGDDGEYEKKVITHGDYNFSWEYLEENKEYTLGYVFGVYSHNVGEVTTVLDRKNVSLSINDSKLLLEENDTTRTYLVIKCYTSTNTATFTRVVEDK